ncbi:MAG TPA: SURF1 family protein [Gemmatimonadales bacterium]|nr:SURF1 family protein [Gemmatimonadales bacterium]
MRVRSRLLLLGCFVAVALVCARLGLWQVHRLRERRAVNAKALAARSKPPVMIEDGDAAGVGLIDRRVVASGRYDDDHTIILRARVYQGVPGVEIVSPLLLHDGRSAVLVNRGFVPTPDAFTVDPDPWREPGTVRVEGIALPIRSGGGAPLQRGKETAWAQLDLEAFRTRLPYPISPVYIRQLPDSTLPRFPRRLEPLALDDGPHLSYAIQWFSFSVMALVFGVVIGRQRAEREKPRLSP